MAKKTKSPVKTAGSASSPPSNLDPDVAKKVAELKAEGNNCFARGDYAKAISLYDDAIKVIPGSPMEKADFYNNKAACYIGLKRYKDAVVQCTSALEVNPASAKALNRRSKAYEQQGMYKQALADMQAVNKSELATNETREAEKRLKEAVAGRRSTSVAVANGSPAPARAPSPKVVPNQLQNGIFTAKCSLGDDTRMVHLSLASNYADLLSSVQAKFPSSGHFQVKYVDAHGEPILISNKADLQVALTELFTAYQKMLASSHGPKLNALPPMRILLTPVSSEAEVPKPPADEEQERQQVLALQRQQLAKATKKEPEAQPVEEVQLDAWLVDFANLFMQMTGLEPDKHIDLNNMGWDLVSKGLDAAIHHEQAVPLFDKAKDNFRDVACMGLNNWGSVHQMMGTRALEAATRAGRDVSEVEESVMKEFAEAERRFNESLQYNPEFFDSLCAMAQLDFERCKLKAGMASPAPEPPSPASDAQGQEAKTPEQVNTENQEAVSKAQKLVLAGLKAEKVAAAAEQLQAALGWADKAVAAAPQQDDKKKEQEAAASSAKGADAQVQEYTFRAQALVLKGNFLYEWSQMLAATGSSTPDWKSWLDQAVALFREAGCPEKDVRAALGNHIKVEDLDLGPEPEAEPEAQVTAPQPQADKAIEAEKPKVPEAKGLPSLQVRKKKAAAAEPAAEATA